jgi:hypothetical protein
VSHVSDEPTATSCESAPADVLPTVVHVFWMDIDPDSPIFNAMYANHKSLITLAALSLV